MASWWPGASLHPSPPPSCAPRWLRSIKACGQNPRIGGHCILWGVKPVVIAIVGQAAPWRLAQSAIKTWLTGIVALLATAANPACRELAVGNDAHDDCWSSSPPSVITASKAAPSAKRRTTLPLHSAWPLASKPGVNVTATMSCGRCPAVLAPLLPLFLNLPENRLGPLRLRLCSAGVPAKPISSTIATGSRKISCSTPSPSGKVTPGYRNSSPPRPSSAILVSGPWGRVGRHSRHFPARFRLRRHQCPALPRLPQVPRSSPPSSTASTPARTCPHAAVVLAAPDAAKPHTSTASPSGTIDSLPRPAGSPRSAPSRPCAWKNVNSIWLLLAIAAAVGVTAAPGSFHKTERVISKIKLQPSRLDDVMIDAARNEYRGPASFKGSRRWDVGAAGPAIQLPSSSAGPTGGLIHHPALKSGWWYFLQDTAYLACGWSQGGKLHQTISCVIKHRPMSCR